MCQNVDRVVGFAFFSWVFVVFQSAAPSKVLHFHQLQGEPLPFAARAPAINWSVYQLYHVHLLGTENNCICLNISTLPINPTPLILSIPSLWSQISGFIPHYTMVSCCFCGVVHMNWAKGLLPQLLGLRATYRCWLEYLDHGSSEAPPPWGEAMRRVVMPRRSARRSGAWAARTGAHWVPKALGIPLVKWLDQAPLLSPVYLVFHPRNRKWFGSPHGHCPY